MTQSIPPEAVDRFFDALPSDDYLRVRAGSRAMVRACLEASGALFLTDKEKETLLSAADYCIGIDSCSWSGTDPTLETARDKLR